MKLRALYDKQVILDHHILTKHDKTERDTLRSRIAALVVEAGEMMNEIRTFKYWSTKGKSSDEVILDEFVDGLHFILSLGNSLGLDTDHAMPTVYRYNITTQFNFVVRLIARLDELIEMILEYDIVDIEVDKLNFVPEGVVTSISVVYEELLAAYLGMAKLLNFTDQDIFDAYNRKNAVNFTRQKEGY